MYPPASAPHLLQLTTATAAAMAALQAARPLIVRVKRDEANAGNDSSSYGVTNAMAMAMGVGSLHGTDNDVLTEVDIEDETQPGEVAEDMVSRLQRGDKQMPHTPVNGRTERKSYIKAKKTHVGHLVTRYRIIVKSF